MEANLLEIVQKLMDPEVIRSLPEDFQDSPVDFLTEVRLIPSPLNDSEIKSKYTELSIKLDRLNEEMRKLIPAEKQKLFARLYVDHIDVLSELNLLENKNLYRNGLRDGFWLALELLANRPGVLKNKNGANKGEKEGTKEMPYPGNLKRFKGHFCASERVFAGW